MLGTVIHQVQKVIHHQNLPQNANLPQHLSGMSEMAFLNEIKEQLAKVGPLKPKYLTRHIDFVLNADEKAYKTLQNVTYNYLKSMNKNVALRKEVEEVVHHYLRQMYTTYVTLITAYQSQSKLNITAEKNNLVLGRCLNAAFMMAKWRYFDDQPAPIGMWKNVHKIIRTAEASAMMNTEFFLYGFQKKETSIAMLLKRGFMLDTMQKGSYSQLQIELTDRILKTWSTNPLITSRYTKQKEYQFFIHMNEDNRPQRIRGAKQHPDFRYWRTTDIVDLIEGYLCAVDTRKSLDKFNLLTMAATEDIVSLFKKLRVDWCVKGYKRQRRAEERVAKLSVLNVSHGINDISTRIRSLNNMHKKTGVIIEYQQLSLVDNQLHNDTIEPYPIMRENWVMLEESSSGFSVELGDQFSPWVKIGALIGYSVVGSANHIALAEIKTVRNKANGTYRIGLLKMSQKAIELEVKRVQKSTPYASASGYILNDGEENLSYSDSFSGLFIEGELQDRPKLIISRYNFKRAARYQLNINGDCHMVLAGQIVSNHREWVCFELIV
ncbi:MAG: hypothetical protein ACSHWN_07830 [Methylophilaceae bacterium]